MSKYYVAGIPFDSENSLQHYGVKNMEWGKHKFGLDADPRYIKWLKDAGMNIGQFANRVGQNVGRAATTAARTAGTAVNRGANFVMGNQNRQNYQNAQRASQYSRNPQRANANAQNAYNQAQAKTLPGIASSTARKVGQTASEAARNAQNWAGQQARNVGNAVQNAANTVDQNLNITGNQDREKAEQFRKYADQAQSKVSKDYWNKKAAEADQKANSSLAGKANTAVQKVGDWAGAQAKNVGQAVGNAANGAKEWAGQAAQDVGKAAQNAGQAVGNFFSNKDEYQRLEDLANHYNQQTGEWDSEENRKAFYDAQDAYNFHPLTDIPVMANQIGSDISNSPVGNFARDIGEMAGQAAQDVGKWVGKNVTGDYQRGLANMYEGWVDQNRADRAAGKPAYTEEHDQNLLNAAAKERENAKNNTLFGRIGNAANAAGNWIGDRASDVGNAAQNAVCGAKGFINSAGQWVSDTAGNVGRAAQDTAKKAETGAKGFINSAGQWVSTAAGNVKNAAQDAGQAVGNAANAAGDWAKNAAQDAKNFVDYRVTGAGYNQVSPDNPEIQEAFKDISESKPSELSVDSRMTGFSTDPRMVYSPQEAMQYMQEVADQGRANSLFGRIGNAAQNAGQWVGDRASDVGSAVGNAANGAKDWAGQAAQDIGGAANSVGDWASNAWNNVSGKTGRQNAHSDYMNKMARDYNDPGYTSQQREQMLRDMIGAEEKALSNGLSSDYFTGSNVGGTIKNNLSMIDYYKSIMPNYDDYGRQQIANWIEDLRKQNDAYANAVFGGKIQHSAIDEKPEGVSDAFWEKFVADGGTREEYERDWR